MRKRIIRCKECGFEFIAFDDGITVHEQLTGHKEYEDVGEFHPWTPVRWIVEGGMEIVIPWKPSKGEAPEPT